MTAKLTTLIEQFRLVNGTWQATPHNQTAIREPQRQKTGKGNLFILVEAQGHIANLEAVEKRLVALVRDTYFPSRGGITASLRRSLQAANGWLHEQNNTVSQEKRIIAGVVAVVIHQEDLYMAQAGPVAMYSAMSQVVQRHPRNSVWLDQAASAIEGTPSDAALGITPYVAPRISHLQLQSGDLVVLADSHLTRKLRLDDISRVLRGPSVEVMSQNLAQVAGVKTGSAMILQVIQADAPKSAKTELEPATTGLGKGLHFSLPNILPGFASATLGRSEPTATEIRHPVEATSPPASPDSLDFDQATDQHPHSTTASNKLGDLFRKSMVGLTGTVSFLGSGLDTVLKLVLPGSQSTTESTRQAGTKAQSLPTKQPSRTALKYVAIGLPIFIILVTVFTVWFRGYNREQAYTTKVSEAQAKFAQAQSAAPETAIVLLAEAEQELNAASAIKAEQPEVSSLKTSITTQRDLIGQVERLYYVPELQRFEQPGTRLGRVIIQGVQVYVLDEGLGRVFRYTLDDLGDAILPDSENPQILQQGQTVDNVSIDEIIDMVWMPAVGGRQTSDLLILSPRGLLEFNPDWGVNPIPVGDSQLWQEPIAAGNYFGNFYLLDRQGNRLLRYRPGIEGYEDPPESYFPEGVFVDLSNTVDMAIDGYIYLLYQTGEIKKFLGGEPVPFQITGLDVPLNNPTAIYAAPDEQAQYLYIADAGNQRIVQLDKEGAFMRQFKPREADGIVFDDLRSIYVDEISGKMFILNGYSLYAPNIPVQ